MTQRAGFRNVVERVVGAAQGSKQDDEGKEDKDNDEDEEDGIDEVVNHSNDVGGDDSISEDGLEGDAADGDEGTDENGKDSDGEAIGDGDDDYDDCEFLHLFVDVKAGRQNMASKITVTNHMAR